MNMFAAKQSGVASLIESMIPADILIAVKTLASQITDLLPMVKAKVEAIEAAQIRIEGKLDLLHTDVSFMRVEMENLRCKLDPDATPRIMEVYPMLRNQLDSLPVAVPEPTGDTPSFEVTEKQKVN